MTEPVLQTLDESDCYVLLRSRTLGRIGIRLNGEMTVLPVYYAVLDQDIVFRTSLGTKLNAAVLGVRVAFETDNASPPWSVHVRGYAHEMRGHDEKVHARTALGHDWPAGEREHYVRIVVDEITGRRVHTDH